MARPREFDEAAVLKEAQQCFWEHGYEATSVRDLAARTGLTSASLYNAFGDKRALYGRVLDNYVDATLGERLQRIEGHLPPREAIAAFFNEVIARTLSDRQRKGCMLVNSALEMAPHDLEFRDAVADVFKRVEQFFLRCVCAGQKDGTITQAQSPEDLARMMLSVHLGIRVLARIRPERDLLEGLVRPVFAILDNQSLRKGKRPK